MEARITCYYDRRSDKERREEALWGDFAIREFLTVETAKAFRLHRVSL
jgi:hypothetical protein